MLTDQDIRDLEATTCEQEWNAICDRVKAANGGDYPFDWFHRVNLSGLAYRAHKRWTEGD